MKPEMIARLKRTALLSLIALIVGVGAGFVQIWMGGEAGAPEASAPMKVAGADIGGPFTLVDQDGKTVTEKDFAGRYRLIYFGFTYCPAICPTELQKISSAMKKLEGEKPALAEKIQPLFITVDPERDTPAVMKDYISLFHPRLIGLSGSVDQIEAVKKVYRVYSSKVTPEGATEYTVDHSSFIYLMSPEDEILGIYKIDDGADVIEKDLIAQIKI